MDVSKYAKKYHGLKLGECWVLLMAKELNAFEEEKAVETKMLISTLGVPSSVLMDLVGGGFLHRIESDNRMRVMLVRVSDGVSGFFSDMYPKGTTTTLLEKTKERLVLLKEKYPGTFEWDDNEIQNATTMYVLNRVITMAVLPKINRIDKADLEGLFLYKHFRPPNRYYLTKKATAELGGIETFVSKLGDKNAKTKRTLLRVFPEVIKRLRAEELFGPASAFEYMRREFEDKEDLRGLGLTEIQDRANKFDMALANEVKKRMKHEARSTTAFSEVDVSNALEMLGWYN